MQVNRELAVGLFLVGAMAHYDADEVVKYADIQYIAKVLKKKHFDLKNGTAKMRFKPSLFIKELMSVKLRWELHVALSNQAWINTGNKLMKNNSITVSGLILAILRKEPDVMKYYGFNKKKIDKFQKVPNGVERHNFASSRVASTLLELLDAEIAHYNYRRIRDYFNKENT